MLLRSLVAIPFVTAALLLALKLFTPSTRPEPTPLESHVQFLLLAPSLNDPLPSGSGSEWVRSVQKLNRVIAQRSVGSQPHITCLAPKSSLKFYQETLGEARIHWEASEQVLEPWQSMLGISLDHHKLNDEDWFYLIALATAQPDNVTISLGSQYLASTAGPPLNTHMLPTRSMLEGPQEITIPYVLSEQWYFPVAGFLYLNQPGQKWELAQSIAASRIQQYQDWVKQVPALDFSDLGLLQEHIAQWAQEHPFEHLYLPVIKQYCWGPGLFSDLFWDQRANFLFIPPQETDYLSAAPLIRAPTPHEIHALFSEKQEAVIQWVALLGLLKSSSERPQQLCEMLDKQYHQWPEHSQSVLRVIYPDLYQHYLEVTKM